MGVLKYLKNILPKKSEKLYSAMMTDSIPIFTNFGNDIYLSDFVNNAIDRIATEISKIEVKSVVQGGDILQVQNDDITRLFRFKPNPLQTTQDFLSNVEWLRRKNRNAFIYPQYETVRTASGSYKRYTALYPLKPMSIRIGIDGGNIWGIEFTFEDGSAYTLPYADLIHLRWRRGISTIVGGGDDYGYADDRDILKTISALDKTIQGLPKSIEASLQIKGVVQAKSLIDRDEISKVRDKFEEHIFSSRSGIVATDLSGEFVPIKIDAPEIPDNIVKFLKAVIQERYGISAAIISGDYNGEQHDAFYQNTIEDFITQFEQAATACLFTLREQDVGHRIKCYYSKVNYMATADKMNLANLAKETGIMTLNQINEMFGIEPFEGGDRRLQSLNYVNINDVDNYQKSKAGVSNGQE